MLALQKMVSLFLQTAVSPIDLLAQSNKLVVGVSGGPDSLALLHLLAQLVTPTRLVVAHVNHGYRETAVAEAAFVQETAEKWGAVYTLRTVDVPQVAQDTGSSLEEAGRKARYNFFSEVAEAYETPYIVVGHHADDQAETVLMNLLRGTGLQGLRGMLPVTPLPETPGYFVLRPFLTASRHQIEGYCRENELTPAFDASNEDISFFRNRVRQELLPLLATYNEGIYTHLQQLAMVTAADVAVLDALTAEMWAQVVVDVAADVVAIDRAAWRALPLALRRRVLRQALAEKRPFLQDITFQAIEQARLVAERNETGQRFNLPGNLFLIVDYERLIVTEDAQVVLDDLPQLLKMEPQKLTVPGRVALANDWRIAAMPVEDMSLSQIRTHSDQWRVFVTVPAGQELVVRPRRRGERFQPLGMNGRSATVQDVMVNRKISANLREKWPLVACDSQIVWLTGHLIDERMKITEETSSILQLTCHKG